MRAWIAGAVVAGWIVGCTQTEETLSEFEMPVGVVNAATTQSFSTFGVGRLAPTFEGLMGVDGQQHSLDEYAKAKVAVIAFTCNHCPVAVAYEDRLIGINNDYVDKGVQLLAINVNNLEEDKLPAMKQRSQKKGFQFPYLYDPSQQVARDYGATVTPHIFLLDGQRRLAYVGPVDDHQNAKKVSQHYLRDAIDAVLAGTLPDTTDVKPVGCSIKYE